MTAKILFQISIIVLCFISFAAQATQEGDNASISKDMQNNKNPLINLLSSMKSDTSLEEKKAKIKQLTQFTKNDIQQLKSRDIPLKQFDNIFDTILKAEIPLSDDITAAIWKLYIKKVQKEYGPIAEWEKEYGPISKWEQWEKDIISPTAKLFFLNYNKNDHLIRSVDNNITYFLVKLLAPDLLDELVNQNNFEKQSSFRELVYLLSRGHYGDLVKEEIRSYCKELVFYFFNNINNLKLSKEEENLIAERIVPAIRINTLKDNYLDQFDRFFDNILKSKIPVSSRIIASIWELYMEVLVNKYGKVSQWEKSIISSNAKVILMNHINDKYLTLNMREKFNFFIKILAPDLLNKLKDKNNLDKQSTLTDLINLLSKQKDAVSNNWGGTTQSDAEIGDYNKEFILYFMDNLNDIPLTKEQEDLMSQKILSKIMPEDISLDQFDHIFGNILKSKTPVSDAIITPLWKLYIQVLRKKYDSLSQEGKDIISPNANILFLTRIIDNFLKELSPGDIVFFNKFLAQEVISYLIHNINNITFTKRQEELISQIILSNVNFDTNQLQELHKTLNANTENKKQHLYTILEDYLSLNLRLSQAYPKALTFEDIYNANNLKRMHEMIFSDLPGMQFEPLDKRQFNKPNYVIRKIIYNLDGYTTDQTGKTDITDLPPASHKIHKGKPIVIKAGEFIKTTETPKGSEGDKVEKDIPIGYDVYLPFGSIKGVLLNVYGGYKAKERVEVLSKPDMYLDSLDSYLMSQGIAVIKLNLIDLLELENFQEEMPELLHKKLHASINKFFECLRGKDPDKILQGIIPSTAKIYLYGASFGGRTAIRQAELYPDTFDGYISHDGAISSSMGDLSDLAFLNRKKSNSKAVKWIDPLGSEKIKNINQPILILHNFDDNNVNIKVSLHFYEEALKEGKGNLIKLFITSKGNEIMTKQHNKGHFTPTRQDLLKRYIETISSFILEGPTAISKESNRMSHEILSEWAAHQYTIYADKHYNEASFSDKFISEAYRRYKNTYFRTGTQQRPQKSIKQDELTTKKFIESFSDRSPQQTEEEENLRFEKFWKEKALPLYYRSRYFDFYIITPERLETEIKVLFDQNKLSDLVIEKTLNQEFPGLLELSNQNIDYTLFAKNKWVQDLYKYYLQIKNDNFDFKKYMLYDLYNGNPDLLSERITELLKDPTLSTLFMTSAIGDEKEKLHKRIIEDKQFLKKRMMEMGNLNDYNKKSGRK